MGILEVLKLPPRPDLAKAQALQSGAAPGKDVAKTKAEVDRAWKDVLAFAAQLKDRDTKVELAQALKACDAKRKNADAASADPARQVALMQSAMEDMRVAREAANKRSAEIPRAMADKHRPAIEKHYQASYDEHAKLVAQQAGMKKAVAAANGDRKTKLTAALAALDKKVETAQHHRDESQADLEALDNPEVTRKELDDIVARHDSKAVVARHVEVDTHDAEGHLPGEKHVTTTATSVANGASRVDKTEVERTIGPGSVTNKTSKEREITTAEQTARTSEETSTKISVTGVSRETSRKSEVERGGKTVSVEDKSSLEIGKEGITGSKTRTITGSNGASVSSKSSSGLVRGEGQIGAAAETEKTRTDASGNASTKGLSAKTGVVAGDDGYGAASQAKGSVGSARKGGFNTKAALGLKANITCDIGDPKDGLYPLTLSVRFGASLDLSAGHDKKGGSSKGGVAVQASKEATMEVTQNLTEAELADYVAALKKADKGGKVDATMTELAIISAGASQGWDIAKRMYLEGGAAVGKNTGDSAKLGEETHVGASANVKLKAVTAEAGYKEGHKHSTTATRNKKGGIDAESDVEDTSSVSGGAGVDTGLTGMTRKGEHTVQTSIGYLITIDAEVDPDGKLLAAFHACKTAAAQQKLIDANKDRIKLTGQKKGKADDSTDNVGFSVLGADIDLKYKHGTKENVTTDDKGNVVNSEVTGTNEVGGGAGIGQTIRIGDSTKDTASSKHDDKGKLELNMKRTRSSSSLKKTLKSLIGMADEEEEDALMGEEGEKNKRKPGLLAAAAGGGEADVEDHDVAGIRLAKPTSRRSSRSRAATRTDGPTAPRPTTTRRGTTSGAPSARRSRPRAPIRRSSLTRWHASSVPTRENG